MNYKDKKYLSEDRWLVENLNSLDFFFVAQLKSCDSDGWIKLQRDLSKLNLKIRLTSFKNIKNLFYKRYVKTTNDFKIFKITKRCIY